MVDQENFRLCQKVTIRYFGYDLVFHRPARTSRDVLQQRKVWFVIVHDPLFGISGVGECAPISGLSAESALELEQALQKLTSGPYDLAWFLQAMNHISSLRFGLETALLDLQSGGKRMLFPDVPNGNIPINGLVWMNEIDTMRDEAKKKVADGFDVIKFKVGALDFEHEVALVRELRETFPEIVIRLDANGAFTPENALAKLERLAAFNIHSIEQPIKQKQWPKMAELIKNSPIPIALDEELIGVNDIVEKQQLLEALKPPFIILKPSLHGGITGCDEWINLAEKTQTAWWATSALESSIGLNAIARWVLKYDLKLPQGLGTGMLYENNLTSPWKVEHGQLIFDDQLLWDDSGLSLS